MTTPPPPPPPASWPPSTPAVPPGGSWWTTGRVAAAVAIVLALMAVSAVGGFVAGSAVDAFDELQVGADGDVSWGGGAGAVPGGVPLDTAVATGQPLAPGERVEDVVADRPVEHELVLDRGASVVIEVVAAEFDSVLVVLDADGGVVTSDDDGGRAQLSRIEVALEPGTHRIRVQPWMSTDVEGGAYTLSVD